MSKVSAILRDAAGLLGCASISAGAGMIYVPAGLIVAGGFLLAGALLAGKRG